MPADELFLEPMKTSTIADYRHTGGKGGGTIAAGLLIREFAEGRHFAHLDIAGPALPGERVPRLGDRRHRLWRASALPDPAPAG